MIDYPIDTNEELIETIISLYSDPPNATIVENIVNMYSDDLADGMCFISAIRVGGGD